MKASFNKNLSIIGVCLWYSFGIFVVGINPFEKLLTYTLLYGYIVYLRTRANIAMNDGISSKDVAPVHGLFFSILATSIIFAIAKVGEFFFLVNLMIFLIIVTIYAIIVHQNQDIVPYGNLVDIFLIRRNKALAEKLRQDIKNNPGNRPRSEHLAELILSVVNTSGVITAAIAYIMYQAGWFVQR